MEKIKIDKKIRDELFNALKLVRPSFKKENWDKNHKATLLSTEIQKTVYDFFREKSLKEKKILGQDILKYGGAFVCAILRAVPPEFRQPILFLILDDMEQGGMEESEKEAKLALSLFKRMKKEKQEEMKDGTMRGL